MCLDPLGFVKLRAKPAQRRRRAAWQWPRNPGMAKNRRNLAGCHCDRARAGRARPKLGSCPATAMPANKLPAKPPGRPQSKSQGRAGPPQLGLSRAQSTLPSDRRRRCPRTLLIFMRALPVAWVGTANLLLSITMCTLRVKYDAGFLSQSLHTANRSSRCFFVKTGFKRGALHATPGHTRRNARAAVLAWTLGTRALRMMSSQCTSLSPLAFAMSAFLAVFKARALAAVNLRLRPLVSDSPVRYVWPFSAFRTFRRVGVVNPWRARLAVSFAWIAAGAKPCPRSCTKKSLSTGDKCGAIVKGGKVSKELCRRAGGKGESFRWRLGPPPTVHAARGDGI